MHYTDQMGREVFLPVPPKRIISLVPSQTELLFDLGLEKEIVGITKFCIHPKVKVTGKCRIGGTKKFKFDIIDQLKPDLIIGNKEENYKERIDQLAQAYPVWMSDIYNLNDSLGMIGKIGEITNRISEADYLVKQIQSKFALPVQINTLCTAAYLIWKDPYMVAGGQTFINEMMKYAGFSNIFESLDRYPQINEEMLCSSSPDLIFLSSEPYPFKENHISSFKNLCPTSKVILVDGEIFSWYGSRLLNAPDYFDKLHLQLI